VSDSQAILLQPPKTGPINFRNGDAYEVDYQDYYQKRISVAKKLENNKPMKYIYLLEGVKIMRL
jgi:hypothetical protein